MTVSPSDLQPVTPPPSLDHDPKGPVPAATPSSPSPSPSTSAQTPFPSPFFFPGVYVQRTVPTSPASNGDPRPTPERTSEAGWPLSLPWSDEPQQPFSLENFRVIMGSTRSEDQSQGTVRLNPPTNCLSYFSFCFMAVPDAPLTRTRSGGRKPTQGKHPSSFLFQSRVAPH